jgi:hypothetical protein
VTSQHLILASGFSKSQVDFLSPLLGFETHQPKLQRRVLFLKCSRVVVNRYAKYSSVPGFTFTYGLWFETMEALKKIGLA